MKLGRLAVVAALTAAIWVPQPAHAASGTCQILLVQNPAPTYQLTQFSVNTGVIGPNIYIWQYAEILDYQTYYGYMIGWVNRAGSTASGPFVAGGNYYQPTANLGTNILVMVPLSELSNTYLCGPSSPVPYFH
jgi:hypothetical protein